MSNQLPPSKFGAGTTYGESGQAHALPKSPPPPTAAPQSYPAPDPYASTAYQAPPTPDPYAVTSPPAPPPNPPAAAQFTNPVSYPGPPPGNVMPMTTTSGAGSSAAVIAATLGLAGAIWYAVDAVRGWSGIEALLMSLDSLPNMSMDGWDAVLAYGMVGATVAQLLLIPALLIGGVLLLARNPAGRTMVALGSVLVIAANICWAATAIRIHNVYGSYTDSSNEFIGQFLLNIGLPLLLAFVVLVLASANSTKQWCRRTVPLAY